MEKAKHTLQDLLGEISLTEKKLNAVRGLDQAVITEMDRPAIGFAPDSNKFNIEVAKTNVQAKLQSALALVERLGTLKTLRDKTNMATEFTCEGKKFTIHSAIMWKRSISHSLENIYNVIVRAEQQATRHAAMQSSDLGSHGNRGKKESIVDVIPLVDVNQAKKELEVLENIKERLDATITRVNSTTEVEY